MVRGGGRRGVGGGQEGGPRGLCIWLVCARWGGAAGWRVCVCVEGVVVLELVYGGEGYAVRLACGRLHAIAAGWETARCSCQLRRVRSLWLTCVTL